MGWIIQVRALEKLAQEACCKDESPPPHSVVFYHVLGVFDTRRVGGFDIRASGLAGTKLRVLRLGFWRPRPAMPKRVVPKLRGFFFAMDDIAAPNI